jgi:thioredoxin reductase (NADPH)
MAPGAGVFMMQENRAQNDNAVKLPDKIISDIDRKNLGSLFDSMEHTVELHVYAENGAQDLLTRFDLQLAREFSQCSSKIKTINHTGAESKALPGLPQRPLISVRADGAEYPVMNIIGAPLGQEAKGLVKAITIAGNSNTDLSAEARKNLARLKEKRDIKVFGTGT